VDALLYKVNGFVHSWASSELIIGASPFVGITEMSYGDKRTRAKVVGMNRSGVPLGRTSGKYEADPLTFKVLIKTYGVLLGLLTAKGLGSAGSGGVPIIWKCFEPKSPPLIVTFEDCLLEERSTSLSEGPDAITRDLSFNVKSITENGMVLYSRGPL
jgi:hypothetical protein